MKYYFWLRNGILQVISSSAQASRRHRPQDHTEDLGLPHPALLLRGVIDVGEGLLWLRHPQEPTQRPPALLDLKHQQPVSGNLGLDLCCPLVEEPHGRLLSRVDDTEQTTGISGAEVGGGPAGEVSTSHGLTSETLEHPKVALMNFLMRNWSLICHKPALVYHLKFVAS